MPSHAQQTRPVAPPAATTVQFAAAARALAAAARRFGLAAPSFRTPPRLVGLDRTLRRHPQGGVVAVHLRGRPWAAVVADMIEGVVVLNRLDARSANRARADLWHTIAPNVGSQPVDGSSVTDLRRRPPLAS
jgi:hypothetical protein